MKKNKKSTMEEFPLRKDRYTYITIFGIAVIIASVMIIPFILKGNGILFIGDDYNLEFINFNKTIHAAIRSGEVWWTYWDELGNSPLTSYSWSLTSPFFLVLLIFPNAYVPFLMGPLLIVKYAVASLIAYLYIKRYVKNNSYAMMGALMYAFCGMQITQQIFFQFHDVVAFFPLLLLALDKAVEENKKHVFLGAVALNCYINYYFFISEVIFVLLYLGVKVISKEYHLSIKKFIVLTIESLLGVLLNAIILLPIVHNLLNNPRATQTYIGSKDIFISTEFWKESFYNMIYALKAFIMVPEVMHYQSLITINNFKSVEAYMPLFGIVLVIAYIIKKRKDWICALIILCFALSLNQVTNSVFYLFNTIYYARWLFMLVLIMALASAKALEDEVKIEKSIVIVIGLWLVLLGNIFIYGISEELGQETIVNAKLLIFYVGMTIMSIILSYLLIKNRGSKYFEKITLIIMGVLIIISGGQNLFVNQSLYPELNKFKDMYIESEKYVKLPVNDNYRLDTLGCYRNCNMLWKKSSIYGFNNLVPGSVYGFYEAIGLERPNIPTPFYEYYALRPFLSVQYVVEMTERPGNFCWLEFGKPNEILPHLEYYDTQGYYTIWKNKDFIPMGYTYDYYVPEEYAVQIPKEYRHLTLLKGMVLSDEQVEKYKDIIAPIPSEKLVDVGEKAYEKDVLERNKTVCSNFEYNKDGFAATITLDTPNLIFFSVPYDKGWRAEINGEPIEIEKVNYGFMAVEGEAGMNEIKFIFRPYGLKAGAIASLVGIILTGMYIGMNRWKKNK